MSELDEFALYARLKAKYDPAPEATWFDSLNACQRTALMAFGAAKLLGVAAILTVMASVVRPGARQAAIVSLVAAVALLVTSVVLCVLGRPRD